MKLDNVKNTFSKSYDYLKDGYATKVKPALDKKIKYVKDLKNDTVEFVKANPKKAGKYAAVGLLAATTIGFIVKGIKDLVAAKKQNTVLSNWVVDQRATINDLKEVAETQKDIIAAQQMVINGLKREQ